MSDRSYFQIIILKVGGPRRAEAIAEILEHEGITCEYAEKTDGSLELGKRYVAEEMSLDTYTTLADQIIGAAPSTTFECWNDPKYEYGGGYCAYSPGLGRFEGDCDSDGNPYLTAPQLRDIIEKGDPTVPLAQRITERAGIAWQDLMTQLSS